MDIMIASIALLVAAPFMLIVFALVRITMGGPALFAQTRVGFGGRTFMCFKFRTMVTNSAEILSKHLATNSEAAREWRDTCKLSRDPRITHFGRLLRKSSIDELPQLINVLRGEMSCVGPRPVVAAELHRYGAYAADYCKARPGLTGFWQVNGRSKTSYAERIALDRFYVRKWSIGLDLALLLKTIPAVLDTDRAA